MATVIDPVCGMQLDDQQTTITSQYMNRTYYFCSLGCKQQFDNDPQQYAVQPASTSTPDDQTLAGQGSMGARPLDRSSTGQSTIGADPDGQWNTEQGTSGERVSGEGMTGSGSSYDRSTTDAQQDAARRRAPGVNDLEQPDAADWESQQDTSERS
ncbi:MAG TPA: YHS domain-containing protein [Ktedonobacterales bacterium]|jgi:YHS domain-containing protein